MLRRRRRTSAKATAVTATVRLRHIEGKHGVGEGGVGGRRQLLLVVRWHQRRRRRRWLPLVEAYARWDHRPDRIAGEHDACPRDILSCSAAEVRRWHRRDAVAADDEPAHRT